MAFLDSNGFSAVAGAVAVNGSSAVAGSHRGPSPTAPPFNADEEQWSDEWEILDYEDHTEPVPRGQTLIVEDGVLGVTSPVLNHMLGVRHVHVSNWPHLLR